jgi:hypothetical protein
VVSGFADGAGVVSVFAAGSLVESFSAAEAFKSAVLDPPDLSLRAQPVPLKWTAGAEKAFFSGPPHLGHSRGPSARIEWRTSIRCPQFEQM